MEVAISLNPLSRPPPRRIPVDGATYSSLICSGKTAAAAARKRQRGGCLLVIEAKGKKGMAPRPYQRMSPPPPLPQLEDDGNPKFVIFIRMASIYLWFPLNIVTGGTSAKLMVAAKENFIGKYIYKDALARNLAAVVYRDEKELQKMAMKRHRVLRSATEFRYGYKLVEKNNLRAALSTSDIIELPQKHELKTVLDKVKDFFGDAKESFGKLTALNLSSDSTDEDSDENSNEKTM
ncbi:hypothetical protein DM860_009737 [Cuscuta australis]|uniref:Protein HHL1, chloroplastic n=1 Tax=Cuscuta australis TaxID=267555 RepID=A0A328DB37_9ASTE|nr:hypothetical protein DM860_009737 [Cuscuta australis]